MRPLYVGMLWTWALLQTVACGTSDSGKNEGATATDGEGGAGSGATSETQGEADVNSAASGDESSDLDSASDSETASDPLALGGSGNSVGSGGNSNGGAVAGSGGEASAAGGAPNNTAGSSSVPAEPAPSCDREFVVDSTGTTPGEAQLPYPTLRHVTMEWLIEGDDDLDSVVTVRYRAVGGQWRSGMPLRRVPAGEAQGFTWNNKHAGSLFDLEPGTAYEVELSLQDPDGGCETRTLETTTRSVPVPAPDALVVAVTPDSIEELAAAATPGDILELAPGTYGELSLPVDGVAAAPIVLRGSEGSVIEGDLRLDGRSYIIVEGLEVHGQIKFNDARELSIVGCTVLANTDGIVTYTRAENLYIADNVVTGVTEWVEAALGVDGDNVGEGILVTGPGHVIEHNRVSGFRDAISLLEDEEAVDQFSIDILNNDISEAADDGVEADFCFHDCRIVGNRLTNTFIALSSQPGLGGPTYFVRNVVFNTILSAFKLQRGSVGDVALHNTVVKEGDAFGIYTEDVFSRQYFRNNVFIGGPGGEWNGWSSGSGDVLSLDAAGEGVDLDYDGYGSTLGTFSGSFGAVRFESLEELQSLTTEANAVAVDLSIFADSVAISASPFPGSVPPSLQLAPGGAAIDQGTPIPNLNDGFSGNAPDLGAYELGSTPPSYGPR